LHEGLATGPGVAADAADTLRLAEAIRELAVRHGAGAVRHCARLVEDVRHLLDETMGGGGSRP
jgi:hypothetical protein